ncbi:hypothetical protein Ahy_B03g065525 [Arachis hypogaea]|uniref:Uncharacterized protein n=1 Tax=Arachis hypogaea TaxID=3818 RepID=A0A445A1U4_ARAHY|nr:hypothetical protein Ahy_B03g065525 [Arachis hypogaea]
MTKRKIISSHDENTSTHEFNDSPPIDQNESSQSMEPEPTLSTGSEVPHVQLDVQGRKSNKYWTVDLEGLLLGAVAGNFKNFPISYEKWPLVPTEPYKNGAYRDIIQNLTREQNIALLPKGVGVSLEQWATFIDYRLRSRTQETANKRVFTRVEIYPISHKKKDGSFVNDEARKKSLFGKEHPGHFRGVGFGVFPSQVMKSSNSLGGVSSSCNHDFDMAKVRSMEVELQENKATISLLQAQVTDSPIETRPPSTIP